MRIDLFKQWLKDQECQFDELSHGRGQGHVSVVAKLKGKESNLPRIGAHQDLNEADIKRVVEELGLDMSTMPTSQDTESEKYRHDTTSRG